MPDGVVLISGGSRGLGLALVQDCLRHGWNVATFSRSNTQEVEDLRTKYKDRFFYCVADQGAPQSAQFIVNSVRSALGGINALVNNAAIGRDGILASMPEDQIRQLVQTNLTSVLLLTRECIREFLRAPRSHPKTIVNISSIVSVTGFNGLSAYASTKSALLGMTRSLARELGRVNVTVNAVLPGFLETEMSHNLSERQRASIIRRTALGRLGKPSDITPLVRFLMSEQSRFITGQFFIADGGATC